MAKPGVIAKGDGWEISIQVSGDGLPDSPSVSELLTKATHEMAIAQREELAIEKATADVQEHNDAIAAINATAAKGALTVPAKA